MCVQMSKEIWAFVFEIVLYYIFHFNNVHDVFSCLENATKYKICSPFVSIGTHISDLFWWTGPSLLVFAKQHIQSA